MLERLNCDVIMMRVAHLVALGIDEARDDLLSRLRERTVDKVRSVSAPMDDGRDYDLGQINLLFSEGDPPHGS